MIDPATSLAFSMFENRGVYALLLGSGVSRAAHIPTGWEVTLELARRLGALETGEAPADPGAWHQERFGEAPNYSSLLARLAPTSPERRSLLQSLIEPTAADRAENRKIPTAAHAAIARLVRDGYVRVIVTTNFDRLLENALRAEGVEPVVIRNEDDLLGAPPLIHCPCLILKIHGDYLDDRLLNTETELATYSAPLSSLLDRILDEHGLIVCGWSADWDPALRASILRAPNRRYPMFWASRTEPGQTAEDLLTSRGGRRIPISDADAFFSKLQASLALQETLDRPNPRSTDLLVATAKSWLARPEDRIRLHDLVREEVETAVSLLNSLDAEQEAQPGNEAFFAKIARLEAIMERLVRVFAVMGRWSNDSELPLALDILRTLARRSSRSGYTLWSTAATYPAVLLFHAYGVGAAAAGRLSALRRWLSEEIAKTRSGDPGAGVDCLFLWNWDQDQLPWKHWPGLERSWTPLSDYLAAYTQRTAPDLFVSPDQATDAIDLFEMLASVQALTLNATSEQITSALAGPPPWNFIPSPFGRFGPNRERRNRLVERLQARPLVDDLMEAGFAGSAPGLLSLALSNITSVVRSVTRRF